MPQDRNRPRLGRGLASLIRNSAEPLPQDDAYQPVADHAADVSASPIAHLSGPPGPHTAPVDRILTNPDQPRRNFDPDALHLLAESIRTHGLLQPVLVTRLDGEDPAGPRYQLIAGERRLRAAQKAGLTEVPCIIRDTTRQERLELALIENIHRADLNAVERATAYRDLMDRFGLTQQQLAERMGEPRASIANYLRLLDLCDSCRDMAADARLSFGHARALAGLSGNAAAQEALAARIIEQRLSVRQVEQFVQDIQAGKPPAGPAKPPVKPKSAWLTDVERQLSEAIGTKVVVRPGRGKHTGRVVIDYYSLEDFDRIVGAFGTKIES